MIKAKCGMVTIKGNESEVKAEFVTIMHAIAQSGVFVNEKEARECLDKTLEIISDTNVKGRERSEKGKILGVITDFFVSLFGEKEVDGAVGEEYK